MNAGKLQAMLAKCRRYGWIAGDAGEEDSNSVQIVRELQAMQGNLWRFAGDAAGEMHANCRRCRWIAGSPGGEMGLKLAHCTQKKRFRGTVACLAFFFFTRTCLLDERQQTIYECCSLGVDCQRYWHLVGCIVPELYALINVSTKTDFFLGHGSLQLAGLTATIAKECIRLHANPPITPPPGGKTVHGKVW